MKVHRSWVDLLNAMVVSNFPPDFVRGKSRRGGRNLPISCIEPPAAASEIEQFSKILSRPVPRKPRGRQCECSGRIVCVLITSGTAAPRRAAPRRASVNGPLCHCLSICPELFSNLHHVLPAYLRTQEYHPKRIVLLESHSESSS